MFSYWFYIAYILFLLHINTYSIHNIPSTSIFVLVKILHVDQIIAYGGINVTV